MENIDESATPSTSTQKQNVHKSKIPIRQKWGQHTPSTRTQSKLLGDFKASGQSTAIPILSSNFSKKITTIPSKSNTSTLQKSLTILKTPPNKQITPSPISRISSRVLKSESKAEKSSPSLRKIVKPSPNVLNLLARSPNYRQKAAMSLSCSAKFPARATKSPLKTFPFLSEKRSRALSTRTTPQCSSADGKKNPLLGESVGHPATVSHQQELESEKSLSDSSKLGAAAEELSLESPDKGYQPRKLFENQDEPLDSRQMDEDEVQEDQGTSISAAAAAEDIKVDDGILVSGVIAEDGCCALVDRPAPATKRELPENFPFQLHNVLRTFKFTKPSHQLSNDEVRLLPKIRHEIAVAELPSLPEHVFVMADHRVSEQVSRAGALGVAVWCDKNCENAATAAAVGMQIKTRFRLDCASRQVCAHMYRCQCADEENRELGCIHYHAAVEFAGDAFKPGNTVFVHLSTKVMEKLHVRGMCYDAKSDVWPDEESAAHFKVRKLYEVDNNRNDSQTVRVEQIQGSGSGVCQRCPRYRRCPECKICRHSYVCNCDHYRIKGWLCEHCHAVAMHCSADRLRVLARPIFEYESDDSDEELLIERVIAEERDERLEVDMQDEIRTQELVLAHHEMSHGIRPNRIVRLGTNAWMVLNEKRRSGYYTVKKNTELGCLCDVPEVLERSVCPECRICSNDYTCSCTMVSALICKHIHAVHQQLRPSGWARLGRDNELVKDKLMLASLQLKYRKTPNN